MPTLAPTPTEESQRMRTEIDREVSRLPAMQARAFRMRELEGKESAAICAAMGIDEGRLFALLLDARLALCRALFRQAT